MKRIGLLGGMSWESSLEYYRIINETVKEKLGSRHSAECVLCSVDFEPFERLQHDGSWEEIGSLLCEYARRLERSGADILLLCTNTMHKVADKLQESTAMEFIHIADVTAEAVRSRGLGRIALLGTRFTMEEEFYRRRLEDRGLTVIIPPEVQRAVIHHVIYDELCLGIVSGESRLAFEEIIRALVRDGAEGIVLGCTEIPLLVRAENSPVPLFDTTAIHARAAVESALRFDEMK